MQAMNPITLIADDKYDLDHPVKLMSQDGAIHETTYGVIKQSNTLVSLVNDSNNLTEPIPVSVTNDILVKVLAFLTYHSEQPAVSEIKGTRTVYLPTSGWDVDYFKIGNEVLFPLSKAANYLHIPSLLDMCQEMIARQVRGKRPEEIRKLFNLKDDFTEEEKAQIRRENEWLQKK